MVLNWPHIHLMLNHFPILGTFFGLALLAAGMYFGSEDVKKAALWTFAVTACLAVVTFLTGEPAEDAVEGLACVAGNLIEAHEEFAEGAMSGSIALGVLSLAYLWLARGGRRLGVMHLLVALAGAAAVSGAMAWTANLGGMIHHEEFRPGYVAPASGGEHDD